MNISIFLAAVAVVESNTNDLAVGAAGERSRYQITPLVWSAYALPTERPESPSDAYAVAVRYINAELLPALIKHNRPVTPYDLATTWNYGPKAAWVPPPIVVVDYAYRVEREYNRLVREEEFLQPTP